MIDRLMAGRKKTFGFPEPLLNTSVLISWAGIIPTRYRHDSRSSSGEKTEHKLVATGYRALLSYMWTNDESLKINRNRMLP